MVLAFNTTASLDLIAAHVSAVQALRASLPRQTLAECGAHAPEGDRESVRKIMSDDVCGLSRLVGVMMEVSKFQALYGNATKAHDPRHRNQSALHFEYGERREQMVHLRRMVRALEVGSLRKVCEVGFNAGHGTTIWLEGTDVEVVHSFDIMVDAWSAGAAQLISSLYPGRHVMHAGDSIHAVPAWWRQQRNANTAVPCDLWYIDGAHVGSRPYQDLVNALHTSRNGTIVIADDCTRYWGAVLAGWGKMLLTEKVRPSGRFPGKAFYMTRGGHGHGFCAGVFVK